MNDWPRNIVATFLPQRMDDLRPEARFHIGERMKWSYCWIAEPSEPYAGERIWQAADFLMEGFFGTVPESDLADIAPSPSEESGE